MLATLFVFVYLAFQAICFGALIQVDENIVNRINKLESADGLASKRMEDLEKAILDLEKTVQRKDDRIKDLEELVKNNHQTYSSDLKLLNERLAATENDYRTCASDLTLLNVRLTAVQNNWQSHQNDDIIHLAEQGMQEFGHTENGKLNQTIKSSQEIELEQNTIDSLDVSRTAKGQRKTASRRIVEGTEAFTAILEDPSDPSDRVQHVGLNQVIKYNKIITNVGNSYSIHSGIFTVPTNGLYLFQYTATTGWESESIWVRLMVDSTPQNAAVVQSVQYGHDLQGGNFALLNLRQGQDVWVETFKVSDVHIQARFGDDLASKRIEYLEKAIVDLEMTVQRRENRIKDLEELVKDNHHTCSSDITLLNERLRELTIRYQTCSSNLKLPDEQLTEKESNCKTNQINEMMHIGHQESQECNQTAKTSQEIQLEQKMTDSLNIRGSTRDKIPSFLELKKITRRNVGGTIAFTAILEDPSGRVQHVGLKQVVKYNKIITNVGNSYSIHSGIFTIPTNGIYMFHYTVATGWEKEKNIGQAYG